MIKYAAVPILAILAACSAEVEDGEAAEANAVETLSVNNLVVTDAKTAAASNAGETIPPPGQAAQSAAPAAKPRTTPEPKQQTVRKPATEAAAKPAPKPNAAPAAEPKPEAEAPADTCTAEHREMGHC